MLKAVEEGRVDAPASFEDAPNQTQAQERAERLKAARRHRFPGLVIWLEETIADPLAIFALPAEHRKVRSPRPSGIWKKDTPEDKWSSLWNITSIRTRLKKRTTRTRRQRMESSPESRCGEIAGDIFIIFVTGAQLIFFTFFHKYIAWYTTEPDGSVTRLSMLTDDYFTWLPIPITASIIVIVASIAMIVYDNYRFRMTTQIMFNIIGIAVTVSLVSIFPFDFSVIPNATAVDVVPKAVRAFFILLAVFYGVTALIMFAKLKSHIAEQETR